MRLLTSFAALPLILVVGSYFIEGILRKSYSVPPSSAAVVISGASSGIGRDAAIRLASLGYTVFAGVRTVEAGQALQTTMPESSRARLHPLILDVTSSSSVAEAAKTVTASLDRGDGAQLHGLINNAGIELHCSAGGGDGTVQATQQTLDVNVVGMVRTSEAFLPLLRRTAGARVVNIGSLAGRLHRPNDLAYIASKHAVEGLSDAMRLDLQPHGLSVSLIQPGFVASSMCGHAGCVALPNTTTTPAIEHAMLSPYPRTRYAVSETYGIPASLSMVLSTCLPDRLKDLVILLFERPV